MGRVQRAAVVLGLGASLGAWASCALGQAIPDTIGLRSVGLSADAWVWAGSMPGDRDRLLAMEGGGSIFVVDITRPTEVGGLPTFSVRPTPFLTNNSRQARSVVFAPDFVPGVGGRFYVAAESFVAGISGTSITEYRTRADDPWQAEATSARQIMRLNVVSDHAVGSMAFDSSGMLLIGVGDAFNALNSQNLTNLFGKMLRIDVLSGRDDYPADANQNYAIPADNPLVSRAGARPEILHIGLRNPWRWGYDKWRGDMWIADVGAGDPGEISRVSPAASYLNFGWAVREGNVPGERPESLNPDFTLESLVAPLVAIRRGTGQCSTSGGALYAGAMLRGWRGRYVWGDYCRGMWSQDFSVPGSMMTDHTLQINVVGGGTFSIAVTTIAEDGAGEIYMLTGSRGSTGQGAVYAIVPQGTQPALADIAGEGGSLGADGEYDNNDFIVFIQQFFANDPRADIGTQGGVWGADFVLDNNDFIVFIGAFFEGR